MSKMGGLPDYQFKRDKTKVKAFNFALSRTTVTSHFVVPCWTRNLNSSWFVNLNHMLEGWSCKPENRIIRPPKLETVSVVVIMRIAVIYKFFYNDLETLVKLPRLCIFQLYIMGFN